MKYFKYSEFDSPDLKGSGREYMDPHFLDALDIIRDEYGKPMKVNSGYRTEAHNKSVGGVENSQHRYGLAADIHIDNQIQGDKLEKLAKEHLVGGIGRYNTFIHIDGRGYPAKWDKR